MDPAIDLKRQVDRCDACPIRHRAVCSYADPRELAELDSAKFYSDYTPGAEIVGEAEPTTALGSIVTGVVALHKTLEDGRRQMVGLLFPSDFIGRPFRSLAPYDAVAVTPVRMCLFHRNRFEEILRTSPSLERRLLEMTLDELDAARDWMMLLGRKTAKERLASLLMILARREANLLKNAPRTGMTVSIPLTREAIAEYLGLTIETVSRQFTALRKNRVLDLPDRKTARIVDLDALQVLAKEDPPDATEAATA